MPRRRTRNNSIILDKRTNTYRRRNSFNFNKSRPRNLEKGIKLDKGNDERRLYRRGPIDLSGESDVIWRKRPFEPRKKQPKPDFDASKLRKPKTIEPRNGEGYDNPDCQCTRFDFKVRVYNRVSYDYRYNEESNIYILEKTINLNDVIIKNLSTVGPPKLVPVKDANENETFYGFGYRIQGNICNEGVIVNYTYQSLKNFGSIERFDNYLVYRDYSRPQTRLVFSQSHEIIDVKPRSGTSCFLNKRGDDSERNFDQDDFRGVPSGGNEDPPPSKFFDNPPPAQDDNQGSEPGGENGRKAPDREPPSGEGSEDGKKGSKGGNKDLNPDTKTPKERKEKKQEDLKEYTDRGNERPPGPEEESDNNKNRFEKNPVRRENPAEEKAAEPPPEEAKEDPNVKKILEKICKEIQGDLPIGTLDNPKKEGEYFAYKENKKIYRGEGLIGLSAQIDAISAQIKAMHKDLEKCADELVDPPKKSPQKCSDKKDIDLEAIDLNELGVWKPEKRKYKSNFLIAKLLDWNQLDRENIIKELCELEGNTIPIDPIEIEENYYRGNYLIILWMEDKKEKDKNPSIWRTRYPNPKKGLGWKDFEKLVMNKGNQFASMKLEGFKNSIRGHFKDKKSADYYFNSVLKLIKSKEAKSNNRRYTEISKQKTNYKETRLKVYRAFMVSLNDTGIAQKIECFEPPEK